MVFNWTFNLTRIILEEEQEEVKLVVDNADLVTKRTHRRLCSQMVVREVTIFKRSWWSNSIELWNLFRKEEKRSQNVVKQPGNLRIYKISSGHLLISKITTINKRLQRRTSKWLNNKHNSTSVNYVNLPKTKRKRTKLKKNYPPMVLKDSKSQ